MRVDVTLLKVSGVVEAGGCGVREWLRIRRPGAGPGVPTHVARAFSFLVSLVQKVGITYFSRRIVARIKRVNLGKVCGMASGPWCSVVTITVVRMMAFPRVCVLSPCKGKPGEVTPSRYDVTFSFPGASPSPLSWGCVHCVLTSVFQWSVSFLLQQQGTRFQLPRGGSLPSRGALAH